MLVTLFTGLATGFGLFYRLLYILGLTLMIMFVWNWLSLQWINVRVERRTRRVLVGDNVEERIGIYNQRNLPKPILEVQDMTDLPGYTGGMALTLGSMGSRIWSSFTPARKRGVFTMGPIKVSNIDPFGLFRREKVFGDSQTLVVYPRTYNVSGFSIPAADLTGESSARRRSHDLTPHASSVREYSYGDSISRIHWGTTARLGKLMSKEFDLGMSSDVWLFVDLHRDIQAGELEESTDEYAVSIAASLAQRYLESGLSVGLVGYGDKRYFIDADTGMGHYDRIIEMLAMSNADGVIPLETALPREEMHWGYQSALVVITPSHRTDWVMALRELTRRRVRVVVISLDGLSFGGFFNSGDVLPDLSTAGIPAYTVRKGDNITVALSQTGSSSDFRAAHPTQAGEVAL